MQVKELDSKHIDWLRIRAEKMAETNGSIAQQTPSPEETLQLLHELQVHKIELEMQNEELRRTREVLETTSKRYFNLFDRAPVGYCTITNEGLVVEANLTIATMLGFDRSDLIGNHFGRFIHTDNKDQFYLYCRKILSASDLQECELQLVKKNGGVVWVQLEGGATSDTNGIPICRITISDLTNRKQIESELEETSTELGRIVQMQKQVINETANILDQETNERVIAEIELSHRQKALEAIYAMETATDSTIDSLYDQVVSSISTTLRIPMVSLDEFREGKAIRGSHFVDGTVSRRTNDKQSCSACGSVPRNNDPHTMTGTWGGQSGELLCRDHSRFTFYTQVSINDSRGNVFGLITVSNDVPRELTDFEVKFIDIFGRYITHELARRDLESRLRRNEELNLLGLLTSGVAHEVRNPLNGILAIMGAISKELENEERFQPYIWHMNTQVTRLTVLMEDLLAMGRPVRKENMKMVSLVTAVETALTSWLQTLQPTPPPVRFIRPHPEEACMIWADEASIIQMIINLLENARDHSPENAEISCSVIDSHEGNIVFSVKDRGDGIPEKNLLLIFNPFFTTRKGGTGLGLSIVSTIIENHHGNIHASNNTDGPGATFTVLLPHSTGEPASNVEPPFSIDRIRTRQRRSTDCIK